MFDWSKYPHWLDIPLFAIFYAFLEYRNPLKFLPKNPKRPEAIQDVGWLYFNELVSPRLSLLFSYLFWDRLGSHYLPQRFNFSPLLAFLIIVTWRDFIYWIYHFMCHRLNFLWRFHELHHSSTRVDWLAGFRIYWLDSFMADILMGIVFFYLDVSPLFMLFWGFFELNVNFFVHTNTKINLGFLKKWINNPYTHHWHHAREQKFKGGQNYGGYTLIWDHLFGTYYLPEELDLPLEYGLTENSTYPKSFLKRFFRPFTLKDS